MKILDTYKQFEFKITGDLTVIKIKMNNHWNAFEYIERMLDDLGYERKDNMSISDNFLIINKISEEEKIWYFQNKVIGNYYNLPEDIDKIESEIKKLENITL